MKADNNRNRCFKHNVTRQKAGNVSEGSIWKQHKHFAVSDSTHLTAEFLLSKSVKFHALDAARKSVDLTWNLGTLSRWPGYWCTCVLLHQCARGRWIWWAELGEGFLGQPMEKPETVLKTAGTSLCLPPRSPRQKKEKKNPLKHSCALPWFQWDHRSNKIIFASAWSHIQLTNYCHLRN